MVEPVIDSARNAVTNRTLSAVIQSAKMPSAFHDDLSKYRHRRLRWRIAARLPAVGLAWLGISAHLGASEDRSAPIDPGIGGAVS